MFTGLLVVLQGRAGQQHSVPTPCSLLPLASSLAPPPHLKTFWAEGGGDDNRKRQIPAWLPWMHVLTVAVRKLCPPGARVEPLAVVDGPMLSYASQLQSP